MQALLGGLMGGGPQQAQTPQPQEQREDQAKWQKFQAPPNEMLDKEGSYKDMKPTSKDLSKFIQRNLQSAIVNAANKQERAVYQQIAKQMEMDESKEKFTDLYNETFIMWLLGKSHYNRSKSDLYLEWRNSLAIAEAQLDNDPNGVTVGQKWSMMATEPTFDKFLQNLDFNPTPWGNKNISFLPGCQEFLDSIVDKRAEVEKYFSKMALNGPRNITDAWMVYKYIIHKNEIDDVVIDYAKSIVGPYELPASDQIPVHVVQANNQGDYFEIDGVMGNGAVRKVDRYTYKYFYVAQDGTIQINTSFSNEISPDTIPADIPPPYSIAHSKTKSAFLQYATAITHVLPQGNAVQTTAILEDLADVKKRITSQLDPLDGIYFNISMGGELNRMVNEYASLIRESEGYSVQQKEQMINTIVKLKTIFPEIQLKDEEGLESFRVQGNMAANIIAAIQQFSERIVGHLKESGFIHPNDGEGQEEIRARRGGEGVVPISEQLTNIRNTIQALGGVVAEGREEQRNLMTQSMIHQGGVFSEAQKQTAQLERVNQGINAIGRAAVDASNNQREAIERQTEAIEQQTEESIGLQRSIDKRLRKLHRLLRKGGAPGAFGVPVEPIIPEGGGGEEEEEFEFFDTMEEFPEEEGGGGGEIGQIIGILHEIRELLARDPVIDIAVRSSVNGLEKDIRARVIGREVDAGVGSGENLGEFVQSAGQPRPGPPALLNRGEVMDSAYMTQIVKKTLDEITRVGVSDAVADFLHMRLDQYEGNGEVMRQILTNIQAEGLALLRAIKDEEYGDDSEEMKMIKRTFTIAVFNALQSRIHVNKPEWQEVEMYLDAIMVAAEEIATAAKSKFRRGIKRILKGDEGGGSPRMSERDVMFLRYKGFQKEEEAKYLNSWMSGMILQTGEQFRYIRDTLDQTIMRYNAAKMTERKLLRGVEEGVDVNQYVYLTEDQKNRLRGQNTNA